LTYRRLSCTEFEVFVDCVQRDIGRQLLTLIFVKLMGCVRNAHMKNCKPLYEEGSIVSINY
jgi:hypothetical protein